MSTPMPFVELASQGIEQFNQLGISGILGGFIIIIVTLTLYNLGRELAK